jgi:catechol 2,3-dioxygenase-like lactoylglutathione lyase family enzyme
MLGDKEAVAMVAVRDIARAAAFYGEVLGLSVLGKQGEEVITYRSGASKLNVYRSEFAGTNKATCALWDVGSRIADVATALAAKGVKFEHYRMPGLTLEGDVHVGNGMKVAWFRDPDGNILSIVGS